MRLIIGMSGASGLPYGIRLLEILRGLPDVETHLVLSEAARLNITIETAYTVEAVKEMAHEVHSVRNIGASIASGSYRTDGMIVAPCSMKTLSAIANSYADNLLTRAADVVLKERRRLVLMPRETPLHAGHCKLMYEASLMGAILCPHSRLLQPPPHHRRYRHRLGGPGARTFRRGYRPHTSLDRNHGASRGLIPAVKSDLSRGDAAAQLVLWRARALVRPVGYRNQRRRRPARWSLLMTTMNTLRRASCGQWIGLTPCHELPWRRNSRDWLPRVGAE